MNPNSIALLAFPLQLQPVAERGLYSPPAHYAITLVGALLGGGSLSEALSLAWGATMADFVPGSQETDNSHWHGMCPQGVSTAVCKQMFWDFLGPCSEASTEQKLHAIQDFFAWGHEGFQEYNGNLFDLPLHHILGDWFPGPSAYEATAATAQFLLNQRR